MVAEYSEFIRRKSQLGTMSGFDPVWMPDFLFPFQRALVEWAVRKGRGALFEDCGLGKTPQQLVWAENVVRHTNRPVLVLAPLAVADQTVQEAEKFGIDCDRSKDGTRRPGARVVVTNYERLHHFDAADFAGVVCDESSAIKHFDGSRTQAITEFMRMMPHRLLCTATASPNDYVELGTSSEALGELGRMDMLAQFFKNDEDTAHHAQKNGDFWSTKWRFKNHAELHFWRWVCSWARAIRRPSDLGFDDGAFVLPELVMRETVVKRDRPLNGHLFSMPAATLDEQREERRATIGERCEVVAGKVNTKEPAVVWCQLNAEGDLLERLIPDAKQVSGSQSDDEKEELLNAFTAGELRVLVIKPKIGAFGLNWQHCRHMTFFPSHSFEQFYQGVRRCLRFGQKRKVIVDIVTSEGERDVQRNLQRKAEQADRMFSALVGEMNNAMRVERSVSFDQSVEVPSWL